MYFEGDPYFDSIEWWNRKLNKINFSNFLCNLYDCPSIRYPKLGVENLIVAVATKRSNTRYSFSPGCLLSTRKSQFLFSTSQWMFTNNAVYILEKITQPLWSCSVRNKTKDRFYSDADPKTRAWQLLDVDRCKNKCLLEICIYSDGHPKLTALFTKQLLDLERCKHKFLLKICIYSDEDPKLTALVVFGSRTL